MRAHEAERNPAGVEELDEERPRDLKDIGGLLRREPAYSCFFSPLASAGFAMTSSASPVLASSTWRITRSVT